MPALHLHKSLAGENNPYLHLYVNPFLKPAEALLNSIASNSDLSIPTTKLFQNIYIAALCTILRSSHILCAIKILRKSEQFRAENRSYGQSSISAPPRARTRQRAAETAEIKRAWSGYGRRGVLSMQPESQKMRFAPNSGAI